MSKLHHMEVRSGALGADWLGISLSPVRPGLIPGWGSDPGAVSEKGLSCRA